MVVRETESVLSPRRMTRRRKARGKPDKPRRRTDPDPTAAQQISTPAHHISKPAVLGFVFFSPCHFGNKCYILIIVKLVRITGQVISSRCSDAETTKELSLPFTVIVPVVCGTPTSVTGYKPDSAGRERAAGRDSNSTPLVRSPCRKWRNTVRGHSSDPCRTDTS